LTDAISIFSKNLKYEGTPVVHLSFPLNTDLIKRTQDIQKIKSPFDDLF